MRKPNSTSKLMSLSEEQQSQVVDWMLDGMPYHKIQALVEKEFNVKVSMGAFSAFWQDCCGPALIARRARAMGMANEVTEAASREPGRFDAATVDALRQRAFEMAIAPGADPKDVKALYMLVLKAGDQDLKREQLQLDERKIKLLEAKAAKADATESTLKNSDLTEDEKRQKIAGIFGMA
jgi:hypothetical protein